MLDFYLVLQVDACDGLGQTDNSLELSHSDGNACALLGDLLVLRVHPISHVHILEDMPGLLRETREVLHLGICKVLLQVFEAYLALCVLSGLGMCVQIDHM